MPRTPNLVRLFLPVVHLVPPLNPTLALHRVGHPVRGVAKPNFNFFPRSFGSGVEVRVRDAVSEDEVGEDCGREAFYSVLELEDQAFFKEFCESKRYRGSGPGGQHRNKVETCMRVTYKPTGTYATGCDHRELQKNTADAIKRLRVKIAVEIRHPLPPSNTPATYPFPGSKGRISPSNPLYPQFIARCLDVLDGAKGQVKLSFSFLSLFSLF
ncbi:hypothetical protein AAMO2058_000767700 [Amorphochlora amoebiformis]